MLKRIALFIAIALAVAACGSDEISSTTAEAPATRVADTTVTTTQPADDPEPPAGEDRGEELLGRWEITNYALPDGGGFTNVVGSDPVFIEFNADGSVAYSTGCNSGGTQYTTSGTYHEPESALDNDPEGQPIALGPAFEQTERGCDGFLGDQDVDLPANMGAVSRFILDGDRLGLLDEFLLIEATR